jgi:hypothetical protein
MDFGLNLIRRNQAKSVRWMAYSTPGWQVNAKLTRLVSQLRVFHARRGQRVSPLVLASRPLHTRWFSAISYALWRSLLGQMGKGSVDVWVFDDQINR